LDYYRRPIRWWKLGLCILFFVLPLVVWAGYAAIDGKWGARLSSPGPVHAVHATWAQQCNVCHSGVWEPTNSRNVINEWINPGPVSDKLCQNCHQGAVHHDKIAAHAALACADCHRDHQGENTSLVRMSDSVCTRCHANLAANRLGGAVGLEYQNEVTRF